VHDVQVTGVVTVDSAGVVLESIRDGDTARDGSSLDDFLHHVGLSNDFSVLIDSVGEVLVGDEAGLAWVAVSAHFHGGACLAIVKTTRLVNRASLVSDVVVVDPLVGIQGFSTVATEVLGLAGDDNLG